MTEKLSQRDSRWASDKLGFGSTTINDYGCTITCIAMLIGITPDVVNEKLKSVNGFTGTNKNLIIWSKLSEAFPGIIKSFTRVWNYDNDSVKQAINKNGGCLVEVDGSRIGASKHWVLYTGNQLMNDPWFGNEKSTSYYKPTGLCVIEIEKQYEDESQTDCDKLRLERDKNWNLYQDEKKETTLLKEQNGVLTTDLLESESKVKQAQNRGLERLETLSKAFNTDFHSGNTEDSWANVIAKAQTFKKVEEDRDEYKDKYDREVQGRKDDYENYQKELVGLRDEIAKMKKQLENIDNRVDEKIESEPIQVEVIHPPISRFQKLINKLLSIFKGKS